MTNGKCLYCHNTGWHNGQPCPACGGTKIRNDRQESIVRGTADDSTRGTDDTSTAADNTSS